MDYIYKNIEEINPNKKQKILSVLMIWSLICLVIKKAGLIVTESLIRGRKLNISDIFIRQSYFTVSKNIRPNSTNYFVMKILNKTELQQIALWMFIINVLQNHILFRLLILILYQIIIGVSEIIF